MSSKWPGEFRTIHSSRSHKELNTTEWFWLFTFSVTEEWPRWWGRKTLSSPPLTGTQKLQLFIEQLLMRKTKRVSEKIFYHWRSKERTITRGQEEQRHGPVKAHKLQDNYKCRGSPQEGSSLSPTLGPTAWRSCTKKMNIQDIWSPVELTFRRAQGLWEIETSLLEAAHKISQALGPRAETVCWKKPHSYPLVDLWETPREAKNSWGLTLRKQTWVVDILGSMH